jgi:uncharacterized membrane protein
MPPSRSDVAPAAEPVSDDEQADRADGHETSARPSRAVVVALVLSSAFGLVASFTLLLEKIRGLQDPAYRPSCSLNPVVSCGSVMNSEQAGVFGFPNPMIGVAAFGALVAIALALVAGARFARWYWWGMLAGTTFGLVFVHWLITQSLYEINALCPYCMVVWVCTVTAFLAVVSHLIRTSPARLPGWVRGLPGWAMVIGVIWVVAVAGLIAERFWYYWQTLV